ncbi:unnamed protein product [marine sediment metagenome]|uniref:Uncharacterized protein n=1 Tax=marine sediment metagenome TaxID=412755 RepID=X1CCE5_9ZZZZ
MAASAEELLEALMEFIIQGRTGLPPFPNDSKFGIGGSNLSRKSSSRSTATAGKRSGRMDKVPIPKKKRKVSRYQRVFGKNLKALKRKHPRSSISVLMKKAHRMTRKELN